jgi:hypothetical protein
LTYDYQSVTPLGLILKLGNGKLSITDRTVMALNPFQDP